MNSQAEAEQRRQRGQLPQLSTRGFYGVLCWPSQGKGLQALQAADSLQLTTWQYLAGVTRLVTRLMVWSEFVNSCHTAQV